MDIDSNKILEDEKLDQMYREFMLKNSDKIDIKALAKSILNMYFGTGWTELIYEDLNALEESKETSKINALYGENEFNENITPNKKEDIFKYFQAVPLEKVKLILLTNKVGDAESLFTEDEIKQLIGEGVFILPDYLTWGMDESIHQCWKPFTYGLKNYLTELNKTPFIKLDADTDLVSELALYNIALKS